MAMTRITLTGMLGNLFGKEFNLNIDTPAEAIKALCAIVPGFDKYILSSPHQYAVVKGKRSLDASGLHHNNNGKDVKIICLPVGAKKGGLTQIFIGIVLIVASFFTAGAAAAIGFSAMAAASAATAVFMMGVSLSMGGLVQMLSPQPAGMSQRVDPDNKPSYAFGGPVNTAALGGPVPVLFGTREIGGAVISAGVIAEDVRV